MRITVIAVGKLKESYFSDAVSEYLKRCSRFADVKVIEVPEAPQGKSADEQKDIEGRHILDKARGYIVAADRRGNQTSSEDLARLISSKCADGISEFTFIIGGSFGLSDSVLNACDAAISFGAATFPHQLFRVMLCEQIYRALTINARVPYHK